MHATNYRPSRSQQLVLAQQVAARYGTRSARERIIVHHVLQDTELVLRLQVERQCPEMGVYFERVEL